MESRNDSLASEYGLTARDWHAHVYFDADQVGEARSLCEAMRDAFGIRMGSVHSDPIGPHPRGSCQITIPHGLIADGLWWLLQHRGRLTVFVHANTGDDSTGATTRHMSFRSGKVRL